MYPSSMCSGSTLFSDSPPVAAIPAYARAGYDVGRGLFRLTPLSEKRPFQPAARYKNRMPGVELLFVNMYDMCIRISVGEHHRYVARASVAPPHQYMWSIFFRKSMPAILPRPCLLSKIDFG